MPIQPCESAFKIEPCDMPIPYSYFADAECFYAQQKQNGNNNFQQAEQAISEILARKLARRKEEWLINALTRYRIVTIDVIYRTKRDGPEAVQRLLNFLHSLGFKFVSKTTLEGEKASIYKNEALIAEQIFKIDFSGDTSNDYHFGFDPGIGNSKSDFYRV